MRRRCTCLSPSEHRPFTQRGRANDAAQCGALCAKPFSTECCLRACTKRRGQPCNTKAHHDAHALAAASMTDDASCALLAVSTRGQRTAECPPHATALFSFSTWSSGIPHRRRTTLEQSITASTPSLYASLTLVSQGSKLLVLAVRWLSSCDSDMALDD